MSASTLERRRFLAWVAAVVALAPAHAPHARAVAGVQVPDTLALEGGTAALALVGAGTFRFVFLPIYVCALYLPPRAAWGDGPLANDLPRRVDMTMLRDVSARLFVWGLDAGLADNTPAAELDAMRNQVAALRTAIYGIESLARGARATLDYRPAEGTTIAVNGRRVGRAIPGKRFNDAVLRAWIGERPLDRSLKEALLGG